MSELVHSALKEGQIVWTFGKPGTETPEPHTARVTAHGLVWDTNNYPLGRPACYPSAEAAWAGKAALLDEKAAALRRKADIVEQQAAACRMRIKP